MEPQRYVTMDQFDELRASFTEKYEQTRKLMTSQMVAVDKQLTMIKEHVNSFLTRRPDPNMVRDAWIKQVPKIRDDLKSLELIVARIRAKLGEPK